LLGSLSESMKRHLKYMALSFSEPSFLRGESFPKNKPQCNV
jgi:hypothetical protein